MSHQAHTDPLLSINTTRQSTEPGRGGVKHRSLSLLTLPPQEARSGGSGSGTTHWHQGQISSLPILHADKTNGADIMMLFQELQEADMLDFSFEDGGDEALWYYVSLKLSFERIPSKCLTDLEITSAGNVFPLHRTSLQRGLNAVWQRLHV